MTIMYTNKYIVKFFRYLAGIDESMLTTLKKKQFYPSSLNPPGENQSNIVAFFKDCAPKLLLRRKEFLVKDEAESAKIKQGDNNATVDVLKKQKSLSFWAVQASFDVSSINTHDNVGY